MLLRNLEVLISVLHPRGQDPQILKANGAHRTTANNEAVVNGNTGRTHLGYPLRAQCRGVGRNIHLPSLEGI